MKIQLKSLNTVMAAALVLLVAAGCGSGQGGGKKNNGDSSAPPENKLSDGNAANKSENTRTTSFSYWFILNGCSTQKQTFETQEALCKGLQDRGLNKSCAIELRQEEFKKVGCVGEFSETFGAVAPSGDEPSPVKCVGRIFGISGEKKIEQTIHWDRKKFQKIVLSNFTDLKDAGEYSVYLIPHEDPKQPGAIKISGSFIDNSKIQTTQGRLDSGVAFYHKDNKLNGRKVEIKCGLDRQDLQAPNYANDEKLEMGCLGTRGPIQGKKDVLGAHFFWDQRSPHTEILKNQKDIKSDIRLKIEVDKNSGQPFMKVMSDSIDGHVQLVGAVQNRMELDIRYMSAWDNRDINISCSPIKEWKESLKNEAEKKNDGPTK